MRIFDVIPKNQIQEVSLSALKGVLGAGKSADELAAAGKSADAATGGNIVTDTGQLGRGRDAGTQARISAAADENPAVRQANDPFNLAQGAARQGDDAAAAASGGTAAARTGGFAADAKPALTQTQRRAAGVAAAGGAAAIGGAMLAGGDSKTQAAGQQGGAPSQADIDKMSFGQAFAAARKAAKAAGHESTGQFTWKGKQYQTNVQGEPYVPMNQQKKVTFAAAQPAPAKPATPTAAQPQATAAGTGGQTDTGAQTAPAEPSPQRIGALAGVQGAAGAAMNAAKTAEENPEAAMGAGATPPAASAQPAPAKPATAEENPEAAMGAGATPPAAAQPAPASSTAPAPRSLAPAVQPTTTTSQQGNTRTTTQTSNVSGTIQGLDMFAARKTPEYQAILTQMQQRFPNARRGENERFAEMQYQNAVLRGQITPPAGTKVQRDGEPATGGAATGGATAQRTDAQRRDFEESLSRLQALIRR